MCKTTLAMLASSAVLKIANFSSVLVRERFEENLMAKVQKLHGVSLNKLFNFR